MGKWVLVPERILDRRPYGISGDGSKFWFDFDAMHNPATDDELVEWLANVVCRTRHGRPLADATDMGRRQCERMARAVLDALSKGATDADQASA